MDKLEFYEQMKILRGRSGLTSRQVSLEAGLSPSYFSKVESGALIPTVSTFATLMSVLKATPQEVYYILSTLRKE